MIIRCEHCSTMYELDQSLLAPTGSQVQCTKCEHVFTAFPPRAGGRTLAAAPSEPTEPRVDAELPSPPRAAAPAPAPDTPPRPPVRTAPPAVYRPSTSTPAAPVGGRAPLLRRDTVGAFEARLRRTARWRWLAPALAIGLVVLAVAGWLLLSRRGASAGRGAHAEALALLARDDAASVDEAETKLGEATRRGQSGEAAAADRALALVLKAAGIAEERDSLAARLSARGEDREGAASDAQAPGAEADGAAVAALDHEVRARDERVRSLSSAAAEHIRAAGAALGNAPEVVRAAAALHALRGDREQLEKLLQVGRERPGQDPWLDLADGWIDARDPERSARERALVKLGALAAARPDLLRGRYLLARTEASLGRRGEALATAEGVLASNRRHEGARRLRDELATRVPPAAPAPLPAEAEPAPPAPAPQPAAKAPPQQRNAVPQPAPGASSPPGTAASEPPPAAPPAPGSGATGPAGAAGAVPAPADGPVPASPLPDGSLRPPAAPPAAPRPPRPILPPHADTGSQGG